MEIISNISRLLLSLLQIDKYGVSSLRQFIQANSLNLNESNIYNVFSESYKIRNINFAALKNKADLIIYNCEKNNIGIITLLDSIYPLYLKHIQDPPPVLYYKGNISKLINNKSVAVVGTRKPSDYGLKVAYKISYSLAKENIVIVSGLALGVDSSSHRGALDANGITVAVLAHGLDKVFPKSNEQLALCILEKEGLILSEHPPLTPPYPAEFVRRNRIQSGLCVASIIIESGEEGGAIHQARYTVKQNRKLYVVLPKDDSESNMSFNRAGAKYLTNVYNANIIKSSNDLADMLQNIEVSNNINAGIQMEFKW